MSGHTPGPWYLDESDDVRALADNEAIVFGHGGQAAVIRTEDAHLIAAAPDLLEALESLTADRLFYYEGDTDARMNVTVVAYENARAAIARAKGEK